MIGKHAFHKAVELINASSNVLMTTHARPDGDACASVVALHDALIAVGKSVSLIFLSEIPEWYESLFAEKVPILGRDVTLDQLKQGQLAQPDLIMIIDTNSYTQLPAFDEYLKQNDKPVLVIDHHITADGLGDVELIDTTAAATGLIVCEFFELAGWPITENIAHALFVAVAADTGWFHFAN
ncbi:MAG: DHH family phosphoesterase, partial [Planctomycetota bacterium]